MPYPQDLKSSLHLGKKGLLLEGIERKKGREGKGKRTEREEEKGTNGGRGTKHESHEIN